MEPELYLLGQLQCELGESILVICELGTRSCPSGILITLHVTAASHLFFHMKPCLLGGEHVCKGNTLYMCSPSNYVERGLVGPQQLYTVHSIVVT